jgi:hypothetical protein
MHRLTCIFTWNLSSFFSESGQFDELSAIVTCSRDSRRLPTGALNLTLDDECRQCSCITNIKRQLMLGGRFYNLLELKANSMLSLGK